MPNKWPSAFLCTAAKDVANAMLLRLSTSVADRTDDYVTRPGDNPRREFSPLH